MVEPSSGMSSIRRSISANVLTPGRRWSVWRVLEKVLPKWSVPRGWCEKPYPPIPSRGSLRLDASLALTLFGWFFAKLRYVCIVTNSAPVGEFERQKSSSAGRFSLTNLPLLTSILPSSRSERFSWTETDGLLVCKKSRREVFWDLTETWAFLENSSGCSESTRDCFSCTRFIFLLTGFSTKSCRTRLPLDFAFGKFLYRSLVRFFFSASEVE